jgi:hypothetical protein
MFYELFHKTVFKYIFIGGMILVEATATAGDPSTRAGTNLIKLSLTHNLLLGVIS